MALDSTSVVRRKFAWRTGRPKAELTLSEEERLQLLRWSRRARSAQALALRSRIVLACAEGLDNKAVAAQVGCVPATVSKWRSRFVTDRLDGLSDEPRTGRPSTIITDQVEDVVVATLESTPGNATHWSRAKMAQRSGLSRSTIGRIWKAFDLKPHRTDGFKISKSVLKKAIEPVVHVVGEVDLPHDASLRDKFSSSYTFVDAPGRSRCPSCCLPGARPRGRPRPVNRRRGLTCTLGGGRYKD